MGTSVCESAILRIMSSALRTSFFLIVFRLLCIWSISRLTLSGSVSLSTRPMIHRRYLGTETRVYSVHDVLTRILNTCTHI